MSTPAEADLPAQRFARLLLGGTVGMALYGSLSAEFPDIRRDDAFFGIALAWTEMAAGLVAAEAEIAELRKRLAAAERRAAA